jgi:protein TonB
MEIKKTDKANLEKKSSLFIKIGLIVALSIILVAFEWTSSEKTNDIVMVQEIQFEDEMMQITRREEPKPEPKPEQPKVAEVLDIVDDDVIIEDDFDFDMEADDNSEYDFTSMMGDDEEDIEEDEIFYIVEDMPTFNGGEPTIEFRKYISSNLRYPEIAAENGISGRVIVQFTINQTGQLTDGIVVRSVDPALDKEAIRVIMSSPKWTPGKQRGRAVRVLFTFPINFVLQ